MFPFSHSYLCPISVSLTHTPLALSIYPISLRIIFIFLSHSHTAHHTPHPCLSKLPFSSSSVSFTKLLTLTKLFNLIVPKHAIVVLYNRVFQGFPNCVTLQFKVVFYILKCTTLPSL